MAFREEHELHKRRFGRNMGLGAVLGLFVALVFGLTIVKVSQEDPMGVKGRAVQSAPIAGQGE